MKKFLKFLGSAAVLCATVAGGIFAYKKFFAPDPFDEDFEDELEEDSAHEETSERNYVSLSPSEEDTEKAEEVEKAEEAGESEEATEEAAAKEPASEEAAEE